MTRNYPLVQASRPQALRGLPVAIASLGLLAGSAVAQSAAPTTQGGRFALQQVEGGIIRMDTQTGALSLCKRQSGDQWACESLPDERKALQLEIDRLSKENGELMAEMKRLEDDLSKKPDRRAEKGPDETPGIGRLPTEDDVDKAMNYLKGMYKKLKEKIKEFEDIAGNKGNSQKL